MTVFVVQRYLLKNMVGRTVSLRYLKSVHWNNVMNGRDGILKTYLIQLIREYQEEQIKNIVKRIVRKRKNEIKHIMKQIKNEKKHIVNQKNNQL